MIEILLKNKEILKIQKISELPPIADMDFQIMQFIDSTAIDTNWLKKNFNLDFSIMKHYEDIEISSHFLESENQISFHFSIPFYNKEKKMVEEPVFIIISQAGLFLFSSSKLDEYFNKIYANKISSLQKTIDGKSVLTFQFEFISDYFADITENLAKKVKVLANRVLLDKVFTKDDTDVITEYNFSNLLIKESLMETSRVFRLYIKSNWEQKVAVKANVIAELNDLIVVSDYVQFNFDRLDDLKENISNKIDLEQNHIFKMLTVATVCISLPTLVAGVYGMNFKKMPILETTYGYPIILIAMIFSAVIPFIFFKVKKWF